ncbi:MAG TPA: recombinase family protein [Bryobacteraceae bacterium]|nr:recombinase family protein [Bryobacteraceae bacterium]
MPKKERIRETLTGLPTLDYLMQRIQLGWRPSAIEWERDIVAPGAEGQQYAEEIPYGLEVSSDCAGLVESAAEKEVITVALDMVVEDCPLSRVAAELNARGFKTRAGKPWTPTELFNLLPRMIQVGPRLFSSEQWVTRRQRLPKVV